MIILGINSYFEHPSVAILRDGELLFAAEDERFTGIKHGRRYTPYSGYLPVDAIYRGLRATGLTIADIDEIGYSYHRWDHLKSLWGCISGRRFSSLGEELKAFETLAFLPRALRSGYEVPHRYRDLIDPAALSRIPFREWNHHLSHAASAFHCSGWDEALTIVSDGAGENACTSVYVGRGRELELVAEQVLPNSLGHFYSAVTQHLGFEPFADEFKVMGLAAYGEPRFAETFRRILRLEDGGLYSVDMAALRDLDSVLPPARVHGAPIEQLHMDIARSAQQRLEDALIHVVSHFARTTGQRRLCLAGGTFLNCVANGKIARLGLFDDIFVQPAASDAGTAVGAAALSALRRGGPAQLRVDSYGLGTAYSDDQIATTLQQAAIESVHLDDADMTERLVGRLVDDRIVAVFRGRMEFGPRALGMRSLLASPLHQDMTKRLNTVKGREGFRPVAPLVTAEAFDTYFDGQSDPYMLFTSIVREEYRDLIPSAVHADGTARVQTVHREADPFLHGVLSAFGESTGHPVLINTSFNVRGKPIVESPADALGCFYTSDVDSLALGGHLVTKSDA